MLGEDYTKTDQYGNFIAMNNFLDFIEFLEDEIGYEECKRIRDKWNDKIDTETINPKQDGEK